MQASEMTLPLGLTPTQARLLHFLMQVEQATASQIYRALYGEEHRTRKCVDVHIHHLRKRLQRHGLDIESLWGEGRRLNPSAKEKISEILSRNNQREPQEV